MTEVSQEQLVSRNVQWFRGWLEFKAHMILYHSSQGSGVITKKIKVPREASIGILVRSCPRGVSLVQGLGFRVAGLGFEV